MMTNKNFPFSSFRTICGKGQRILSLTCLLVVLLTACVNDTEDEATMKVNVGDIIPEFLLSDSIGQDLSSSSLSGRVFILNFIDTNCPDCQKELQVLQRIHDKYKDVVPVLNVPRSQTRDELKAYWEEAGLTLPYYIPSNPNLYYQFATRTIPRTYVIDGNGKMYAAFSDSPTADFDTLDTILRQMLSDAANQEGDVDMTLRLHVSRQSTGEPYFHNEYTISHLDIYFFDATTKEFIEKGEIAAGLKEVDTMYDTAYDITYEFDHYRAKVGFYDIFVIANHNENELQVANENELLNMVDSLTSAESIGASLPIRGPLMTNNATTLQEIDLRPYMNKTYVLNIELERVMAKLQIGVAQNSFALKYNERKYADINITNYKLVNMNKQYYLFKHTALIDELTSQVPEFKMPEDFQEFEDHTGQTNRYVVDPLFFKKQNNMADAARFSDYYLSWYGNFKDEDFAAMPTAEKFGFAYVLENTAYKSCQKNGYSPGIVFKAAVNPVFVYLYDTKSDALREEYRPEYWPRTIYLYNFNFYGSIRDINKVSGLSIEEKDGYTDTELKEHGIKQCKFNMGVYETFYTYWIQNIVNQGKTMLPMEYGIVRNHFYQMRITGVSGIGSSKITPDILLDNNAISYTDMIITSD